MTTAELAPFTFDDLHIVDHIIVCQDTPTAAGYGEKYGTRARCACGWHRHWGVRDGSAEADAAGHLTRSRKAAREAVSPEYSAIGEDIDRLRDEANAFLWHEIKMFHQGLAPNAWNILSETRQWAEKFRRDHFPQPEVDDEDEDEEFTYCDDPIHDTCSCHISAPCDGCEPCAECHEINHTTA